MDTVQQPSEPAQPRPVRDVAFDPEVPAGRPFANVHQLVMVPGCDYVLRSASALERLKRLMCTMGAPAPVRAAPVMNPATPVSTLTPQ
jgi:hypothetical protein